MYEETEGNLLDTVAEAVVSYAVSEWEPRIGPFNEFCEGVANCLADLPEFIVAILGNDGWEQMARLDLGPDDYDALALFYWEAIDRAYQLDPELFPGAADSDEEEEEDEDEVDSSGVHSPIVKMDESVTRAA